MLGGTDKCFYQTNVSLTEEVESKLQVLLRHCWTSDEKMLIMSIERLAPLVHLNTSENEESSSTDVTLPNIFRKDSRI